MIKKISTTLVSLFLLSSCETSAVKPEIVKVYKHDGSVSCDQSSGTSIEAMRLELLQHKIPITAANCGSDGLVRAAVCGIPTGRINVYEINMKMYPTAMSMGYQLLTTLEDYSSLACKV